ncbi:MAG: hypothetical protein AAF502_04605 [Bacteroidota bacterium]
MDFVIFNKKVVKEKKLRKKMVYEISLVAEKLGKWFERYPKQVRFDVHIKKEKDDYRLTYSVDLKSGPVVLEETGEHLLETVHRLFKEFKNVLKKRLEKEKKMHKRHKVSLDVISPEIELEQLKIVKRKERKTDFRKMLKVNLPSIRNYISRVFDKATKDEAWMENQYQFEDVLDEVYLHLFERFEEHPEQASEFKKWLYAEVNDVLKSILKEETFNKDYLESYEVLLEEETKSLEEAYSVEHGGGLVMMEDLDDPSYQKE